MTTFTRIDDSGSDAGAATLITLQELGFFSLTAVRTQAGNLKLINWQTGGPTVSRGPDSGEQAGAVSAIAVTRVRNRTITAVRDGGGNLMLISWDDGLGTGPITRLDDSEGQAGAVSVIAVHPVPGSNADLVTAVRTGAGKLKLITWQVSLGGQLTRLGDSGEQAGEVSLIKVASVSQRSGIVVTAVRTASGTLKLITWSISGDGKTIQRLGDSGSQAGAVSEIAMAGGVTAVRTASGTLQLISWGISGNGTTIQRLGDSGSQAGEATQIAVSRSSATRFVTAVRAGNGALKLISFDVDPAGPINRTGDSGSQAGAVSEVALATPSSNQLTTAVRDGSGRLKIITWRMEN